MKKVLITGVSGTGKSTVGHELKKRGYDFIETDQDIFGGLSIACWKDKMSGKGVYMPEPMPNNWLDDHHWVLRIDVLAKRLDSSTSSVVFACGDSYNKKNAYSLFDKIVVLAADDEALRQRVESRGDNYFGKTDAQWSWIIDQNKTFVDEVSASGGIVIDSNQPLDDVVRDILNAI